jgi:hypothetical protein
MGMACMDLVEDRMSQRLIGVALIFSFYVMLQSLFNNITDAPPPPVVKGFTFASSLVDSATVFQPFSHDTKVHVTSDNGSAMVSRPVHMGITKITQGLPPLYSLDCDSARMGPLRGTLLEAQRKLACTPSISQCSFFNSSNNNPYCKGGGTGFGETNHSSLSTAERTIEVMTDKTGTAKFADVAIEGVPPGILTFSFTAGDGSLLTGNVNVYGDIGALVVDPATMLVRPGQTPRPEGPFVTVGVPFAQQPAVFVRDSQGRPLANRTVKAFAWGHANFFDSWAPTSPIGVRIGYAGSHLRGQNFALLENAESLLSDENGYAVFEGLTVRAATSPNLHLMFYCDGMVASWMDPDMAPSTTGFPAPPKYVSPIFITTAVEAVDLVDSSGALIDCAPLERAWFGKYYPGAAADNGMIEELTRGETGEEPFHVRVGRYDRADPDNPVFVPIEGVEVMAVVAMEQNQWMPFLTLPSVEKARAKVSEALNAAKNLRNAVSTPSDANGLASFPDLVWTSEGNVDSFLKWNDESWFYTAHRIAFCTPGQTVMRLLNDRVGDKDPDATRILFDGCAVSCPVPVVSSVVKIEWSSQPTTWFIRSLTAPDGFQSGEIAALAPSKLIAVPTLRLTNYQGMGVAGKVIAKILLLDMERCVELCDGMTEDEILSGWATDDDGMACPACVADAFKNVPSEVATLTRPSDPSDPGMTGPDGFVTMPVRYTSINQAETPSLLEKMARRKLRLFAWMGGLYSDPSEPIAGFSFPNVAASELAQCASLSPYTSPYATPIDGNSVDIISFKMASRIRPDRTGGIGVDKACLKTSFYDGGDVPPSQTGVGCNRSHLNYPADAVALPAAWTADELVSVLQQGGIDALVQHVGIAATSSWIMNDDLVGQNLHLHDVLGHVLDGDQIDGQDEVGIQSRVVRLIAKNQLGEPVPGLRVRLANLQSTMFPQLPDSYFIVTCNLNRRCASYLPTWAPLVADAIFFPFENNGSSLIEAPWMLKVSDGKLEFAATDDIATGSFSAIISLERAQVQLGYRAWYGEASGANCIGLRPPNGMPLAPGSALRVGMCSHVDSDGSPRTCSRPISAHVELKSPEACTASTQQALPHAPEVTAFEQDPSGCHAMITMTTAWAPGGVNCCQMNTPREDLGRPENDFTDVCETDENGVVEMAIATSMDGGQMGEFVSSGPLGSVSVRYEAFLPHANGEVDLLHPECSSSVFSLGVLGETSKIAGMHDGPDQQEWFWTQLDKTATPLPEGSQDNDFAWTSIDQLGTTVPFATIDGLDFLETPPYLRGFEARTQSCLSMPGCVHTDIPGLPAFYMYDYGKQVDAVSHGLKPYELYSAHPHTTVFILPAKFSGIGQFSARVSAGNPGDYAVVIIANGVRSSPFLFNIINRLDGGTMVISREPDPCTVDGCVWRVGTPLLGATPAITLKDENGTLITGYSPMVRLVDAPNNDAAEVFDAKLDIALAVDPASDASQQDSPLGMRRGTPSNEDGVSYFPGLLLLDALNGTCFYLQFYFASRRDLSDMVRVTSTTRICSGRGHSVVVTENPSESIVNEVAFKNPAVVRADTDMIKLVGGIAPPPHLQARGNMSFWVESPLSHLGVMDLGMVLSSYKNEEIVPGFVRFFLSNFYLSYNWATMWMGRPFIGDVQVLSSSSGVAKAAGTVPKSVSPSGASPATWGLMFELVPEFVEVLTNGTAIGGTALYERLTRALDGVIEGTAKDGALSADEARALSGEQITLGAVQTLLAALDQDVAYVTAFTNWADQAAKEERLDNAKEFTEMVDDIPIWYSQPRTDEIPTSTMEVAFTGMRVGGIPPTNVGLIFGGATSVYSRELTGSAQTEASLLTDKAAGVTMLNQPPLHVEVGEVFLMKVKVTINSGDPLRGQTVLAEVSPALGGFSLSPKDFLNREFNIEPLSISDQEPALAEDRAMATTDAFGIARFSVYFKRAPRHDDPSLLALSFTAGKIKSTTSRPFSLTNPVQSIKVTPVDIEYTGDACRDVEGVGKECVAAIGSPIRAFVEDASNMDLSSLAVNDEAFPQNLPLPPFNVTVHDADGQRIKKGSFEITFRIFTSAELDDYAKALSTVKNVTGEMMADAQSALASGAVPSQDQLLATATGMFTMILSGSQMKSKGPTQGAKDTQLIFDDGGTAPRYTVVDGVAMFRGVKLRVTKAGYSTEKGPGAVLYIQAMGAGVGSKIHFNLTDENNATGNSDFRVAASKYNTKTWQARLTKLGIDIAILVLLGVVVMGNSDFHSQKIWLPISLPLAAVVMALASVNVSGGVEIGDRTLWWLICTVLIMLGYFGILLGFALRKFAPGSKLQLIMRPFAEKRRENYFNYVKILLTRPHLQASIDLAEGEREGTLTLKDRMRLEKEIRDWTTAQRSSKAQLKAVFRNLVKDRQAFNFPVRLYATFVCSVFSVAFLAQSFREFSVSMEQTLLKSDVKAISTIYNVLVKVEGLFLKTTGLDLPKQFTEWADHQVDELHGYIISLADSARVSGIVAVALASLFFALSWLVLVLDFRSKVIQARQGIWTFNVKKIKLYASFTFVGIQISNSMITFVIIWAILFPICLILGWKLTWDVILYILRERLGWLLGFIISPLINIVVKKIVLIYIGNKMVIKNRYAWMAYDLFQIFTTCVTGVMTAVMRFVIATVTLVFSLPRTDVSIMPAWLEYYLLLDSGAKSYRGVVVLHHFYNNPVMRVFVWAVEEEASLRRTRHEECGMLPPGHPKIRLRNKFRKRLMMIRNHQVATYRATESVATEVVLEDSTKKKGGCFSRKKNQEKEEEQTTSSTTDAGTKGTVEVTKV